MQQLRNLEIGTQSRDSENAQRNLKIAQILRQCGATTFKRQPTRKVPVMAEGMVGISLFFHMDMLLLKSERHTRCTL